LARTVPTLALFLALLAACLTSSFVSSAPSRLDYPAGLELATMGKIDVSAGLEDRLVRLLDSGPLDQDGLNLLFSARVHKGIDDQQRNAIAFALGKLGWRSTHAQRNLVVEALNRGDNGEALLRIDALLRRDKLRETILPVLRLIEQDPEVTTLLVERLGRQPNWRQDYFAGVEHLADPAARVARTQLFDRMIRDHRKLDREELRPSLEAFVEQGEPDRAFALLRELGYGRSGKALNYDADFSKAAALSEHGSWKALPSEWAMSNRNGISVRALGESGGSYLAVRWDGAGSPWLMRQLVDLGGQRQPALEVRTESDRDWRELRRLGFQWQCAGQSPLRFDTTMGDQINNRVLFTLPAPSSCDYGYLVLVGMPQNLDQPVQLHLKAIRLLPSIAAAGPLTLGEQPAGEVPQP
jgi:hypothetical protein